MTRKDYELIAGVLRVAANRLPEDKCKRCEAEADHYLHRSASECKDCAAPRDHHEFEGGADVERNRFAELVDDFCVELKRGNARFNEERFRAACEATRK